MRARWVVRVLTQTELEDLEREMFGEQPPRRVVEGSRGAFAR